MVRMEGAGIDCAGCCRAKRALGSDGAHASRAAQWSQAQHGCPRQPPRHCLHQRRCCASYRGGGGTNFRSHGSNLHQPFQIAADKGCDIAQTVQMWCIPAQVADGGHGAKARHFTVVELQDGIVEMASNVWIQVRISSDCTLNSLGNTARE